MSEGRVCIFGEVLFDCFPDGQRVPGGAPFNVAWHLQAFGEGPRFISRVGADAEGGRIRASMRAWGLDETGLQTDPARSTGKVEVRFEDGEPAYDIVEDCAYDAIDAAAIDIGGACKILYHGSLALRSEASREALLRLKAARPRIVFVDVNLRPPWWDRGRILDLLRDAHWVKLNHDELALLGGADGDAAVEPATFLEAHGLEGLIVTHGAAGAELLTRAGERLRASPEHQAEPVDTVGAGDAFASVMILGLSRGWPLETTLARAQALASAIVGQRGATVSDPEFYRAFAEQWGSA